jgi:hypothetical protein
MNFVQGRKNLVVNSGRDRKPFILALIRHSTRNLSQSPSFDVEALLSFGQSLPMNEHLAR